MEAFQWLKDNAVLVSTAVNIGMLTIWVFYAFLFYHQYSRQRQPKIIVHLTNWLAKEAECLVINLTREPVHIEGVLIASGDDGQSLKMITGNEDLTTRVRDGHRPEFIIKQGPMHPGSIIELGRLSELAEKAMPAFLEKADAGETCLFEIRVAAIGPIDRLFGARRRFQVESTEDGYSVRPESHFTEQLTSRVANREIKGWLEEASHAFSSLEHESSRRT